MEARRRRTDENQYLDSPEFLPNLNLDETRPIGGGEEMMETTVLAPHGSTHEEQVVKDDALFENLNKRLTGKILTELFHSYDDSRIIDYNRMS